MVSNCVFLYEISLYIKFIFFLLPILHTYCKSCDFFRGNGRFPERAAPVSGLFNGHWSLKRPVTRDQEPLRTAPVTALAAKKFATFTELIILISQILNSKNNKKFFIH